MDKKPPLQILTDILSCKYLCSALKRWQGVALFFSEWLFNIFQLCKGMRTLKLCCWKQSVWKFIGRVVTSTFQEHVIILSLVSPNRGGGRTQKEGAAHTICFYFHLPSVNSFSYLDKYVFVLIRKDYSLVCTQLLSTAVHEQVQGEGILAEPVAKNEQKYNILEQEWLNKELFSNGCLWVTNTKQSP